jgi:hypothetical protein
MDFKICTKCNNELLATKDNFNSQKNGKFGLRSVCKPCNKIYRKQYTSTDEYKKRHRESMLKWRKENRQEALIISRRSYKKNGKKHNEIRKQKYNSDENFRKEKLLRDKKYTESGRRKELYLQNIEKEKIRVKKWREKNSDFVKKSQEKYRKENADRLRKMHLDKRKNLMPSYVAQCMRIKTEDLTPEVYETKKVIIKLKRELKNNNIKIR